MLIYIFIFIVTFFGAFVNLLYEGLGKDKRFFILSFLFFFLFIGFRGAGYDYLNYLYIYNTIQNGGEIAIEFIFAFLCVIMPNYRILLIVMALITTVFSITFLYKKSPLFLFSLFLWTVTFLLPTFMGQMRQGVAICIILIAFSYIEQKKKFILLVLLASAFHSSALLCFIAFIIPKKIKNIKYYVLTLLFAIIFAKLMPVILDLFFELIPAGGLIRDKVFFYNETEGYVLGLNIAVLIRLLVLFLCLWRKNKIEKSSFPFMLNLYHYSILIYLILGVIPQLGGRASLYFFYYELILIPFFLMTFNRYNRIIIGSCFLLLSLLRYLQFFMDDFNYSEYVPYWQFY